MCLAKLTAETESYGLKIMKFAGLTISMPDEVQEAINKRGAMSALGVNYMQYQSGKAIENIGVGAAQGGDGAGFAMMGAGMGAGIGMGNMMMQGMNGGAAPFGQAQTATPAGKVCPKCGTAVPDGAKFCPGCGEKQASGSFCPECGAAVPSGAKFCPECGKKMGASACPKCGAELSAGAKFCPECGERV